jgi:hypothetical protein
MNIKMKCSCGAEIEIDHLYEEDSFNRGIVRLWIEKHRECSKGDQDELKEQT